MEFGYADITNMSVNCTRDLVTYQAITKISMG